MLRRILSAVCMFIFLSCGGDRSGKEIIPGTIDISARKEPFFPVTSYLKGQIAEIRNEGVNPLVFVTTNNTTDSFWVRIESLDSVFAPFMKPEIDSTNLLTLFSESKFLDQTINAYTFSYDPVAVLPDGFDLQRWDVYVDPISGHVTRIYMLKRAGNNMLQLTWLSDKWSKIVVISTDENGRSGVEKETLIKWDF
jgi:hypothetical protein